MGPRWLAVVAAGVLAVVAIEPEKVPSGTSADASVYQPEVEEKEDVPVNPYSAADRGEPESQYIDGITEPPSVLTDEIPEPVNNSGWETQRLKKVLDAMLDKELLSSETGNGCGQNKSVLYKDVKMTIEASGFTSGPPKKTADQVNADFMRYDLMRTPATDDQLGNCGKFKSCTTCLSRAVPETQNCGWCASLKSCLPGQMEGPIGGANCTQWDFGWCSGEPCNIYQNCFQCVQDPFCGWCGETYECTEGTASGPLFKTCKYWDSFAVGPGEQCGEERELGYMETHLDHNFDPQGALEYNDIGM